jgi:transcription elongation GreA/GreB family factor
MANGQDILAQKIAAMAKAVIDQERKEIIDDLQRIRELKPEHEEGLWIAMRVVEDRD